MESIPTADAQILLAFDIQQYMNNGNMYIGLTLKIIHMRELNGN